MNLGEAWNALVANYDAAFHRQQEAWMGVQRKFAKIANDHSSENPTISELNELEAAQDAVKKADRDMREFIRHFFGAA